MAWLYPSPSAASGSQCGFKAFTGEAARYLFSRQRIQGLAFDTELLYIARQAGLRIAEVPVAWSNVGGSRMRIGGGRAIRVMIDLLVVRVYHRRIASPQSPQAAAISSQPQTIRHALPRPPSGPR